MSELQQLTGNGRHTTHMERLAKELEEDNITLPVFRIWAALHELDLSLIILIVPLNEDPLLAHGVEARKLGSVAQNGQTKVVELLVERGDYEKLLGQQKTYLNSCLNSLTDQQLKIVTRIDYTHEGLAWRGVAEDDQERKSWRLKYMHDPNGYGRNLSSGTGRLTAAVMGLIGIWATVLFAPLP